MSRKRVVIDGAEWFIANGNSNQIAAGIKVAMETGSVVALDLQDKAEHPVTVYFNGKVAVTAVVDFNTGPRPSEISGK